MTIAVKTRSWITAFIFLTGLWLAVPSETRGQVPSYQPRRATLSPYLSLSRGNIGGFPSYFALVRPIKQQRAFNLRQDELNATQRGLLQGEQREIQQLQNDVQRGLIPATATGSTSWFFVPGQQQRFQDTTGYYPAPVITRRQQFR